MGIKTVPQPLYSPDLGLCDFRLFPKLRGCRYETIEEMKEAVTEVIDMLIQEDLKNTDRQMERSVKFYFNSTRPGIRPIIIHSVKK